MKWEALSPEKREAIRELLGASEAGQYSRESRLRASSETLAALVTEDLAHRGAFSGPDSFYILTERGLTLAGRPLSNVSTVAKELARTPPNVTPRYAEGRA